MTGYTRNDTSNNISDGNVINAADLDGEFDAIQAAFNSTTGHKHDGSSAEGAPITVLGPTLDVNIIASAITPRLDNTVDLGSSVLEFRNLWLDGTANIDNLVADTADINGGTVDNATIGAATPAAITGTTITANTGFSGNITSTGTSTFATVDINGGAIDGVTLGTNSPVTQAQIDNININGNAIVSTNTNGNIAITPNGTGEVDISRVDIDAGTIDGTVIGGVTPAAVTGTTVTATTGFAGNITSTGTSTFTTVDINGGNIDGTTIGGTTPAAITGTTITANTGFSGNITSTGTSTFTTVDINGGNIDGTVIGATTPAAVTATTLAGTTGTFSGDVSISDKIVHTGDTNTAIRFPAADTVTVETAGSERVRVNSVGNVGIGTASPAASAILDVSSTTKGFLGPRLTTAQRNAIVSPATGLLVYNTDISNYEQYNGSAWVVVGGGGGYFQGENGAVGQASGKGDIFRVHEQTLNTNTTIAGTDNAIAAGPLTVASGVTLTVASGGNLVIA